MQILRLRSLRHPNDEDLSLGTPGATSAPHDQDGFGFEVSHPSDKNKDVARMGRPKVGPSSRDSQSRVGMLRMTALSFGLFQTFVLRSHRERV